MHAAIARQARLELAAERRVRGSEQDLDIAAREHGGDIAGAGRLRGATAGIGIDLDRDRGRGKARTRKRARGGVGIGHEVRDMVEEDLAGERKLSIGLRLSAVSQTAAPWFPRGKSRINQRKR